MKKVALLFVAALLVAPLLVRAAETAEGEDGTRTLTGEWVWTGGGGSGPLEAIFTPAADATWTVDFHFNFRDKPHVYSGTAEGDLATGTLEGTVQNENKRRTFIFSGSFDEGRFEGTHAETTGGGEVSTGTLTLSE